MGITENNTSTHQTWDSATHTITVIITSDIIITIMAIMVFTTDITTTTIVTMTFDTMAALDTTDITATANDACHGSRDAYLSIEPRTHDSKHGGTWEETPTVQP